MAASSGRRVDSCRAMTTHPMKGTYPLTKPRTWPRSKKPWLPGYMTVSSMWLLSPLVSISCWLLRIRNQQSNKATLVCTVLTGCFGYAHMSPGAPYEPLGTRSQVANKQANRRLQHSAGGWRRTRRPLGQMREASTQW